MPTRTGGYAFDGWETSDGVVYYDAIGAKFLSSYFVTADITLYAKWRLSPVDGITIFPSNEVDAAASGGKQLIKISGNGEEWAAEAATDWLKLNSTSGTATGKSIICTVAENVDAEARVGYVYVAGYPLKVTQAGRGATVEESVMVDTAGEEVAVSISVADETTTWSVRSDCSWIQVVTTNGISSGEAKLLVLPWNKATTRTGTVTVAGQAVAVTQSAASFECPTVATTNVIAEGESGSFAITTVQGVTWTATSDADWLTVGDDGVTKYGEGSVSWEAKPQSSLAPRTATVTVTPVEESGFKPWTFTVTQAAATFVCPDETAKTVVAIGSSGALEIMTPGGVSWTATSDADWLVVEDDGTAKTGNGVVSWKAQSQTTVGETRTATITVKTDAACGDAFWSYVIMQEAATAEISKSRATVVAQGEEISVDVSVADGVNWTISNLPEWVTLDGEAERESTGVVKMTVAPNTTFEDRSATIMIANNEFVVTQNAAKLEIEGGLVQRCDATGVDSLVVTVRVDVATASWTVDTSNDAFGNWIHFMSDEDTGTGEGTFELYVVPASEWDALPRTATIKVGNVTMCVMQGEGVVILNENTSFAIPTSWFAQYPTLGGTTVAEWQTIAEGSSVKTDASGAAMPVWHDYVAGTDPTNALSQFTAKIEMKDGAPVVTWSPALNGEGVREGTRVYRVWGKANLDDAAWSEVEAGGEGDYRFFRVTVEMP